MIDGDWAPWTCGCATDPTRSGATRRCEACDASRPPFCVYLITNKTNGKGYVGYTSKGVEGRWRGHCNEKSTCSALRNAIKRHGRDAFDRTVLEWCRTAKEAKSRETVWIADLGTLAPDGYNLTDGGEGNHPSDETRKKLSRASMGHEVNAKTREAVALSNRIRGLRGVSRETRRKISEASRNVSDETRAKLSAATKARYERAPESQETREKKAAAARAAWAAGKHSTPLSEDTRQKLSAARLRRGSLSQASREKLSVAVRAGKAKSPMSHEGRARIAEASRRRMLTCLRDERGRVVVAEAGTIGDETVEPIDLKKT